MADPRKRVPENVPGEFYVDTTCIDCGTCRELAPASFGETEGYSFVQLQPEGAMLRRHALRALLSCPTGSIGQAAPAADASPSLGEVRADFPIELALIDPAAGVYYCGFASRDSFGGSSYFVRHPDGNWLIDSPRYMSHLVDRFTRMGGVRYVFYTHRDDVADGHRYAAQFGARQIIHRADADAQPGADYVLEGDAPVAIGPDFLVIPTPGHTRGHCALLHRGRFLFSGDHLWFNRERGRLGASRGVCWYSWPEQIASMERLLYYEFEWVLPGHGERVHLPVAEVRLQLRDLVERMKTL